MAPPRTAVTTSSCSLLLIYRPRKDERPSWPSWLTYSGRFTHISGHPSALCVYASVCLSHFLSTRLQVRPLNGFLQLIVKKTRIYVRMCFLGVSMGPKSPKTPVENRHFFKPNMRKIQIAISSDLCIILTWNLTGSCGQQQRLRGWSRMVVKQFQDGGRPPFQNRYIAISRWKIIWFSWNFVHSSRFWTGFTSRDQK